MRHRRPSRRQLMPAAYGAAASALIGTAPASARMSTEFAEWQSLAITERANRLQDLAQLFDSEAYDISVDGRLLAAWALRRALRAEGDLSETGDVAYGVDRHNGLLRAYWIEISALRLLLAGAPDRHVPDRHAGAQHTEALRA